MNIRSKNIALLFSCVLLSISCVDKYLPDSLDAFDRDVNFTTKLYRPQPVSYTHLTLPTT